MGMRRSLFVVVSLLALLPGSAAAAPWSPPRAVTARGAASEPQAALGPGGAAGVAYTRSDRGVSSVELRRGTIGGLDGAIVVSRNARHALDSPALTFDGSTARVAWRDFAHRDHVVTTTTVSRSGALGARLALSGVRSSGYFPRFVAPDLLAFTTRTEARVVRLGDRPVGVSLPAGATFDAALGLLPDGTLLAAWPDSGRVYAAALAPDASGFGPAQALSPAAGYARSPQLAVTSDGAAVVVWTQSDQYGSALLAAARPAGGAAFEPARELAPSSAGASEPAAIGTTAGDVFVAYVAAGPGPSNGRRRNGPLTALRLAPDGHAVTAPLVLTPRGERTGGIALAVDSGAAYAAWVTAGARPHRLRIVRVAPGGIVGAVRTLSGRDNLVTAPPSFAMTTSGRALIAYATTAGTIRMVARAG
jgi:hypothetical protein